MMLALALSAGVVGAVRPALGQRWQVDLSGNVVGYDTAAGIRSASVAPLIEWSKRIAYGTLSGAAAAFDGGGWTSQGHGDVSLLFAPVKRMSRLRTEVVGSVDGSAHSGGYRTAATEGELRFHLAGSGAGGWAGATGSSGWTSDGAGAVTALGATAGAWARRGPANAVLVWSPFRLQGAWYQQVEGRASAAVGPVEVMGYAGWRSPPSVSGLPNAGWAGGSITAWVGPRFAVVASGGSYASDLLQGLPRGRYLSVGVRLSRGRPSAWAGKPGAHALYAHGRGETDLRFAVAGASRVDLVADWTGWQPVPMQRAPDGRWVLRVTLAPGVHRFNLVVDGKRWIVPEGLASVDDGFGGKTCLLVVP